MTDITVIWDAQNNRGDWQIINGDLATGSDLASAVFVSLFTDRLAEPGDVIPDGTTDPRGGWGDIQGDGTSQPIGSRLWLLYREIHTQQTLNRAITYAKQALQWLIDDGVVASVDVIANWNADNFLALQVTASQRNGNVFAQTYNWAWNQIS